MPREELLGGGGGPVTPRTPGSTTVEGSKTQNNGALMLELHS